MAIGQLCGKGRLKIHDETERVMHWELFKWRRKIKSKIYFLKIKKLKYFQILTLKQIPHRNQWSG